MEREEKYKLDVDSGTATDPVETEVVEPLFSEVQILDMLNGSGESIFDIYYDYISMSKQEQANALKDDEFLSSVEPESILLECTAEEVEHFMEMEKANATYQMTLLPRNSSSAIIDSLSDIQEALRGVQASSGNE